MTIRLVSFRGSFLRRAAFTLAARLSPCVIFVDEVDALLGRRNSHKEHEALRCVAGVSRQGAAERVDGMGKKGWLAGWMDAETVQLRPAPSLTPSAPPTSTSAPCLPACPPARLPACHSLAGAGR